MAKHGRTRSFMVAAALGSAFLAACGAGKVNGSVVTGMALSDAPIGGGAVTLTDSSSPVQARQVTTRSDGSFTVDVSGLTAPYMLEVQWTGTSGAQTLHAVSDGTETDITPITDLAFDYAAGDTDDEALFQTASATRKKIALNQATAVLTDVAAELAPLLNQYGIANLGTDASAVRAMLQDVQVTQSSGMVTFSNRKTGGVIARGPRTNPTGGTFDPSQIPSSGSSGQPGGASSGGTSSGGTSSGGASSGGSTSNGATLYASRCANCHGALASSGVKNTTASAIVAKHANLVTSTEADAIAAALSGSSGTSSGGASSGGTFDPCQMPTGAPPSSSGGSFDPSQMPTGAPPGSSGGSFDPGQMPTGAPPGSSSGASSGGFPSSGGMPPSGGCPIPGSSGGTSSGGASSGGPASGGPASGGTSGSTARLPPNHPAISSGATCSSCHTGGMAPGGGAPGGVPGGGAPGGFPGSSSGASSGGTSSSSGGTVSGNLPANHPSVPAGSACSSCH